MGAGWAQAWKQGQAILPRVQDEEAMAPGARNGDPATGKNFIRVAAQRVGLCGQKTQATQDPALRPYQGPEQQACCYHELKSPKPRLGFFLATGTAVLVDGSSSATRFLGRKEPDSSCRGGPRPQARSHVPRSHPRPRVPEPGLRPQHPLTA